MKLKIAATVFLGLWISCIAYAQDLEGLESLSPEENAELITDWMKSKLMLDEAQSAHTYGINLKYAIKNREIARSGEKKVKLYRKLKASASNKDKELKHIFTQDQYRLYQKTKKEMSEKLKQRAKEKRPK